ncbi:MAG: cold shock domain-containing protein [Cyanobacteria bacterium J06634_5]
MLKRFMNWLLHRLQKVLGAITGQKRGGRSAAAISQLRQSPDAEGDTPPEFNSDSPAFLPADPAFASDALVSDDSAPNGSALPNGSASTNGSALVKSKPESAEHGEGETSQPIVNPMMAEPDTHRRLNASGAALPGDTATAPSFPTEVSELLSSPATTATPVPAVSNQLPKIHDILPAIESDAAGEEFLEDTADSSLDLDDSSALEGELSGTDFQDLTPEEPSVQEATNGGFGGTTIPVARLANVPAEPTASHDELLHDELISEVHPADEGVTVDEIVNTPMRNTDDVDISDADLKPALPAEETSNPVVSESVAPDTVAASDKAVLFSFDIIESDSVEQTLSEEVPETEEVLETEEILETEEGLETEDALRTVETLTPVTSDTELAVQEVPIVDNVQVDAPIASTQTANTQTVETEPVSLEASDVVSSEPCLNEETHELPVVENDLDKPDISKEVQDLPYPWSIAIPKDSRQPLQAKSDTSFVKEPQSIKPPELEPVSSTPLVPSQSHFKNGVVKLLFTLKPGNFHGYIVPDDGTQDILFHQKYINADVFDVLERGAKVVVSVKHIEGKAYATRVDLL